MTDYQTSLLKLHNNLNTLRERESKYGGDAPVALLNRRIGGYIFIHRYLMDYFASLTDEEIERLAGAKKIGSAVGSSICRGCSERHQYQKRA